MGDTSGAIALDGAVSELEVMDHCRLLLRGVRVLHERGLELARISPGMAPSGLYWRLTIAPATAFDPESRLGWQLRGSSPTVSWTSGNSPEYAGLVMTSRTTPAEVADHILTLLPERSLRGGDMPYMRWYAGLLAECERLETVPVAFSDSWEPHSWHVGWGGPDYPPPPPAA